MVLVVKSAVRITGTGLTRVILSDGSAWTTPSVAYGRAYKAWQDSGADYLYAGACVPRTPDGWQGWVQGPMWMPQIPA